MSQAHLVASDSNHAGVGHHGETPLTIPDWRAAQDVASDPSHLLALLGRIREDTHNAWITIANDQQVIHQWDIISRLRSQKVHLPLFGVPFAVKDNIDVAGFLTTAACSKFATEQASVDASVVLRLKRYGAIVVGKTNLDQFATGLVGTRSSYGPVKNPFHPDRVSGGSSSGSAVAVSLGLVPFALGTDTAGSGRVPAGFNNVIGLKPTRGALSATGVLPACRTLDAVSILALTIEDAEQVLRLAEGPDLADAYSRVRPSPAEGPIDEVTTPETPIMAICAVPEWFGDTTRAKAYEMAIQKAGQLGWTLQPIDFTLLQELASLLYEGPWVAERYASIRAFVQTSPPEFFDPVVHEIITNAKNFTAVDAFEFEYRRQNLCNQIRQLCRGFDAILVPTSATFPTFSAVAREPQIENSRLGTYTNFVNFMDWTALAIPAGNDQDGLPFGVTLIADAWKEAHLMQWGRQWLSTEGRTLGATSVMYRETARPSDPRPSHIQLAVVGAHLSGFPLNSDLTKRGGVLQKKTTTSARYRLYELQGTSPPKPGLRRCEDGRVIEVEVWQLSTEIFGSFMQTIPSPLGIGSIELVDGTWVHGFICESWALGNAKDITSYGGWRNYKHATTVTNSTANMMSVAGKTPKRLERILIANRGEIAVRIIRTLRKMGILAVSIYSYSDRDAAHVRDADLALPLVGDDLASTYLDANQVLDLALSNDCDAIIPGYGFLAENADFAAAAESAGLTWIGPAPQQMRDMGLKHRARELAIAAHVPVVPGSQDLVTTLDSAMFEARRIGYPVMLKSTAGGGGIGLQKCIDEADLQKAFDNVRRLSQASFGNGDVLIEKFVQRARHIEVQVVGDGAGRILVAGDRDCSLQRRHQKVIEEAPATIVIPEIQAAMRTAAIDLAKSVNYRSVGTIEFIYDLDSSAFYFLEMNTRLQVEHPVTEKVVGLDLVECMVKIAMCDADALFAGHPDGILKQSGASVEARIYAESPLQDFRPSHGHLLEVKFPADCRVDTWIRSGQEVSTLYDPMLAKIVAYGPDRKSAIQQLAQALDETVITGLETNIAYLRQVVASPTFISSDFTTTTLNDFAYKASAIEVIEAGYQTSIQDFPGRTGFWHIGIPPSGPLDNYSFRLANHLVGNDLGAAGIECYLECPTLKFHVDCDVAVAGADCAVLLNDHEQTHGKCFRVTRGQTLSFGPMRSGARVYIAIAGGIDVASVMGSRSTFVTGQIGGFNGRNLSLGDLLPIASSAPRDLSTLVAPPLPIPMPTPGAHSWEVAVLPGPHASSRFFTKAGFEKLCADEWIVHHNSNRMGTRLRGPRPEWARNDGGEAGLHPSNIHDGPYSIGGVSFTGDEAVVLTADGPSLGGFVVFATVVEADMWKFGQMRPGDRLRFCVVSVEVAANLHKELDASIANVAPLPSHKMTQEAIHDVWSVGEVSIQGFDRLIFCRQAGERSVLLQFSEEDGFDVRQTCHIFSFVKRHEIKPIAGVEELTTGVNTVLVTARRGVAFVDIIEALRRHESSLGKQLDTRLPSRTIKLPLVIDDEKSRAAVARYQSTIRSEAPYLPNNIEFLQRLNGMKSANDVHDILFSATFLVLGLGDVYKGSPCTIALDPRHRLFGTKYNPSRSFTPCGSVGIAGQYLCIYAMDSPGGYQLVGRTIPSWDRMAETSFDNGKGRRPWLFTLLDQISFYPITETDLASAEETGQFSQLIHVTDTHFDLDIYEQWLSDRSEDIAIVRSQREQAVKDYPALDQLLNPFESDLPVTSELDVIEKQGTGQPIRAHLPGKIFKLCIKLGDEIRKGMPVVCIEANKMVMEICAPTSGRCGQVLVQKGQTVMPGTILVFIEPVDASAKFG